RFSRDWSSDVCSSDLLVVSGIATAVGILASMVLFVLIAQPIASFALRFGPAEMFALVLFGLTIMISIASRSLLKGLLAGVLGLRSEERRVGEGCGCEL